MILSTQRFLVAGLSVLGLASLTACGDSTSSSGGSGFVQTCWNGSKVTVPDTATAYGNLCPTYNGSVATLAVPAAADITAMSLPAPAWLLDGTSGGENVVFTPVTSGLPTVTAKLGATFGGKRDLLFTTDSLVYGEKYNYTMNFKPENAPAFSTWAATITVPTCSSKGAGYQMIGSWCAKVMTATQTSSLVFTSLPRSPEVNLFEFVQTGKTSNVLADGVLKKAVETDQIPFVSVRSTTGAKIFYPINGSLKGNYPLGSGWGQQSVSIDPSVSINLLNSNDYTSVTAKMPAFVVKNTTLNISSIQAPSLSSPSQQIYVEKTTPAGRTCVILAPGAAPTEVAQVCPKLP